MKSLLQRHPELTVNKPKTVLNQFGKLSSSLSRTSNKNFKESLVPVRLLIDSHDGVSKTFLQITE